MTTGTPSIGFKEAARMLAVAQKRLRRLMADGVVQPGEWVQTGKTSRMRRWTPEGIEAARAAIAAHEAQRNPEEIMAAERWRIAALITSHAEEMTRAPDRGYQLDVYERRSAAYARAALLTVAHLVRSGHQEWTTHDQDEGAVQARHDRMIAAMKAQEAIDD